MEAAATPSRMRLVLQLLVLLRWSWNGHITLF
jgi:hypothetical protein